MTTQQISFYDKSQTDGLLSAKANTADLATVAFTGDYDDLTDKPVIPAAQVNSDWNATSGVAEILNKPTIPAAQVNSDWDAVSGIAQILNKPTLATVATTGDYDDLLDIPNILEYLTTYTTASIPVYSGGGGTVGIQLTPEAGYGYIAIGVASTDYARLVTSKVNISTFGTQQTFSVNCQSTRPSTTYASFTFIIFRFKVASGTEFLLSLNSLSRDTMQYLVSGSNIKTINGQSVLGSGDLVISGNASLTDNTTYYTLSIS